jgi:bifunctional ADP-heptose synthase (sugar kinase/adenylyltransferase)
LDTRSKIIPLEHAREWLRDNSACWVAGHFDPLLAEHVRRLREYVVPGRLLIVEVTSPARPLLPQGARAELVAALELVDYVVLGNSTPESPEIDASVTERFTQNVLGRHREGPAGGPAG